MKKLLIILMFISFKTFSQNLDYLKKLDTIYIPYHGKENEKKYDIQSRIIPTDFKERAYVFKLNNILLSFDHVQFKNWEKKDANIESEVRKVNKQFFKKVKNKIIAPDTLVQFKYEEINCDILSRSKVFYILDFIEKKRKIMLYEVVYMGNCPGIE